MVTETHSGMVQGIEGTMITIQADISDGLPVFNMVGLLAPEVKEARERVRTAFKNTGFHLPPKRISVNLAPADIKKRGTGFDLPIAVALFMSMGMIAEEKAEDFFFLGELALDGSICKVQGVLPILREASRQGYEKYVLPRENVSEAELLSGLKIYTMNSLRDVYEFLCGEYEEDPHVTCGELPEQKQRQDKYVDFADIRGQAIAKRAMTIAAAGFHNIFLDGPPGVGKSMLASAVPGILPRMTREEIIDTTMIYSVKGLLDEENQWIGNRPYRNPGHAITSTGLFGGGADPRPGEISLAHHGVLFLDEFTEYKKDILEMLRIPLEEHLIRLVRNERTITYPCDFLLIAASNPCPCGYYPDRKRCRCTLSQIKNYQYRLSGPILDRMDLFVRCERQGYKTIFEKKGEISSQEIRAQIMQAWQIQKDRFANRKEYFNGRMSALDIEQYCRLAPEDSRMLEKIFDQYHMSGRGLNRILKVARTIADLDGEEQIAGSHLEEALLYRRMAPHLI